MSLEVLREELKKELISVYDNDDFVFGILHELETVEQVQEMLDYIRDGHRDDQDLIIVSLILSADPNSRDENGVLWI